MISREDALKFDLSTLLDYREFEHHINKIYDSIGSCGECRRYTPLRHSSYPYCSEHSSLYPKEDFFCADFERKEK